MTKSFDSSTPGKAYTRIQRVVIDYPEPNTAHVTVTHQQHVPLTDGTHQPIGGCGEVSFELTPADMISMCPAHMPGSDADLGFNVELGQLMVGIYSVIRAKMGD